MKKAILLCSALVVSGFMFGQKAEGTPVLGGDKDAHGCKASAGYTFSYVKNDCVRTFEQKIQLKEQNPKASYTSNAAVIFSKDMKKAEIFVPESQQSVILNRAGKGSVWKRGDYVLFVSNKKYALKKGNSIVFIQ